ncbi:7-methyl bacteriochlorophyllide c oxygenase [Chlorobium phaeobacteroides]|uniref:Radical SAM core domain-containing protein n=1 Tax=Chlorobium phaeobacteroides (strain DSM 266 / SMG 266 / 2430) TaxID=290317 RepID=A1BCY6_CHLPD|nr:7-methyl bacteriochlorophyllide c oxygenase [Chlorobium phaeobacteroides]ABL64263.1 hypothetical protein Cpha266_0196 [Chlorobium phaeobacteroides DSM 266]MBV5328000.1 hypothetical protein [Chlorobium sp.]
MSTKRIITKEDVHLKARLLSEGAKVTVNKPPKTGFNPFRAMVLNGSDLATLVRPEPYTRLEVQVNGDDVEFYDCGKHLASGRMQEWFSWRDGTLSNGRPVNAAVIGMNQDIINIHYSYSCDNNNTGRSCRFCFFFADQHVSVGQDLAKMPFQKIEALAKEQAEAVKIATDNGWRGTLVVIGGLVAPERRSQVVDLVEIVMAPLREQLSPEVFNELHITANLYPPDDFKDMERWKASGINSTEFDLEVTDPDYFKAICPGKCATYPLEYWHAAQDASVEIFGPGRGTTSFILMGLEPMNCMLEGVEERLSKGVYPNMLVYQPVPGADMFRMPPPNADWLVEASEKLADLYFKYQDRFDMPLATDHRPGYTRMGRSQYIMLTADVIARRLYEQGYELPAAYPV